MYRKGCENKSSASVTKLKSDGEKKRSVKRPLRHPLFGWDSTHVLHVDIRLLRHITRRHLQLIYPGAPFVIHKHCVKCEGFKIVSTKVQMQFICTP